MSPILAGGSFTTSASWEAHLYHRKDDLHSVTPIRQWHRTPVLLPRKSHERRSLVGCSPWGLKELDMTERLHFHFLLSCTGEGNGSHSSVLAWRIPGRAEPGGLPSKGSHRVGQK